MGTKAVVSWLGWKVLELPKFWHSNFIFTVFFFWALWVDAVMQALYIINKTELIRHNHLEGFLYVLKFKNFRLYWIHVWMSLNYILYLIPMLLEIKDNPFNILSIYVWLLGVWNFMSKNYSFVWEIWVKSLNLTYPTHSLKPKKTLSN